MEEEPIKIEIMEKQDKKGHESHNENFKAYEANHGIENHLHKEIKPLDDEAPEDAVPEEEGDLTKEDMQVLGPKDLSMDMGDDEDLKQRVNPVDFSADDLDVPGADDDDSQEKLGSEDEENNYYSLGGDRHEDAQDDNPDVVI